MTAPSKDYTDIADTQVDADSPLDTVLITSIRDNLVHLKEVLYDTHTPAKAHTHDGTNSALITSVADGAITPAKLANYAVGNILFHSHDAEVTHNNNTYTKKKSIYLPRGGTLRIKFDLKKTIANYCGGQIRRNGVAVGSVQETNSLAYVTFSQDISGWSSGDYLELWIATDSSYEVYARNLRLYQDFTRLLDPTNTL